MMIQRVRRQELIGSYWEKSEMADDRMLWKYPKGSTGNMYRHFRHYKVYTWQFCIFFWKALYRIFLVESLHANQSASVTRQNYKEEAVFFAEPAGCANVDRKCRTMQNWSYLLYREKLWYIYQYNNTLSSHTWLTYLRCIYQLYCVIVPCRFVVCSVACSL